MPVKSVTVMRGASDGGVKQTTTGARPDGTAINASYTAKYDGKDVQVSGNAPYDTIAIKQVDANRLTYEGKSATTKYHAIGSAVVSKDGKTITQKASGTDAAGKKMTITLVYEKQ